MDSRFDLYLIPRTDGSTNFEIDLKDIANSDKLKNKDLTIKLYSIPNIHEPLRDLHEGSIRLVGYFDNDYLLKVLGYFKTNVTSFGRVSSDKIIGIELFAYNVSCKSAYNIKITIEDIINDILTSIEFFNKLINFKN